MKKINHFKNSCSEGLCKHFDVAFYMCTYDPSTKWCDFRIKTSLIISAILGIGLIISYIFNIDIDSIQFLK